MNDYQRDKADTLIRLALMPDRLIADEHLAEARGYITGLLEGGQMNPVEFSEYHHQILAAQREVRYREMVKLGIAA